MNFSIRVERQPARFLANAPRELQQRLRATITRLQEEPVPHDAKRVIGLPGLFFRVRVGDYRILYEAQLDHHLLLIARIEKRSRVYDST